MENSGDADFWIQIARLSMSPATKFSRLLRYLEIAFVLAGTATGSLRARVFSAVRTYPTGAAPSAAIMRDFNGDGLVDIATANSASGDISILLGRRNGTFQPAITLATDGASALTAGDLDGDGVLDLAVTTTDAAEVKLFHGQGDGTFEAAGTVRVGARAEGLELADFNGDGLLDLVVASAGEQRRTGEVAVLPGNGDGTFGAARTYDANTNPVQVVVADLNGDGELDVAVANSHLTAGLTILLGNGDGTFLELNSDVISLATNISAGDLNNDGELDLVTTNSSSGTSIVLLGNGDGTFTKGDVINSGYFLSLTTQLADLNRDGNLDLIGGGSVDGIGVFLGDGEGHFGPPTIYAVGSLFAGLGDFNLDHAVDVVAAGSHFVGVGLGNGDGTLAAPVESQVQSYVNYIAPGDFNGDGIPDVALGGAETFIDIALGDGVGGYVDQERLLPSVIPHDLLAGDFDEDGNLDLAAAGWTAEVAVYHGNGDGTFDPRKISTPLPSIAAAEAAADFNGDGHLDLALAATNAQMIIAFGEGDGTFQLGNSYESGDGSEAILVLDANGDGQPDVAIANTSSNTISCFLGQPDGTFQAGVTTSLTQPAYLATADFNRDGKADLIVGGTSTQLFLSQGDGTFVAAATISSLVGDLAIADFNADEKLDVAIANGGSVYLVPGKKNNVFGGSTSYFAGGQTSGFLTVLDADLDGNPDVIVTPSGYSSALTVLLNLRD